MSADMAGAPGIEVEVAARRGPSINDPLAQRIAIGVRIRGTEEITLEDPGRGDGTAAFGGDWAGPQQRAVAVAAFEFCDRLYNQAFAAFGRAMGSSDRALERAVEHPTVKLRSEIAGLEVQVGILKVELHDALLQRDELRRLFAPELANLAAVTAEP